MDCMQRKELFTGVLCVVLVTVVKLCAVKRATDTTAIHLAVEFSFAIVMLRNPPHRDLSEWRCYAGAEKPMSVEWQSVIEDTYDFRTDQESK